MRQSGEDNIADITMILWVVTVAVLTLVSPPTDGCVNSCCQTCLPEQCEACYKLNRNPVMCPCVGEIVTLARASTPISSQPFLGAKQSEL